MTPSYRWRSVGMLMVMWLFGPGCSRTCSPEESGFAHDYKLIEGKFYYYNTREEMHAANMHIAIKEGGRFIEVADKVQRSEETIVFENRIIAFAAIDLERRKGGVYVFRGGRGPTLLTGSEPIMPDLKREDGGISYYVEGTNVSKRRSMRWSEIDELLK